MGPAFILEYRAFTEEAAMPLLAPKVVFKNVCHIGLDYLRENEIKALVLDVDNTLTAHGSQKTAPGVTAWLDTMRAGGVQLMLASNNTRSRVTPLAGKLGLRFTSFCCKPLPVWLWKARRCFGLSRGEIALVGDQLFTDLLAGHLCGARVLLVRPMYRDIKPTVRFKRKLEAPLILRYYKKGGRLL
jgi:HAD superfamily phosphatase (TIGR01668 family)